MFLYKFYFSFSNARFFRETAMRRIDLLKMKNKLQKNTVCKYSLADLIEVYRFCHRSLCQMVHDLNRMYKLQLLTTLSACFLTSVCNIYFTIFGYVINAKTKNYAKMQSKLLSLLSWNIHYIMRFLLVTGMAHTTAQQVRQI